MTLPNIKATYNRLKQKVEADPTAVRIVRWGLLALTFLVLTLISYYALDRWYIELMPAGEDATDLQKELYPLIGGGLVGTETAEYLLEKGCTVSIVEMADKIAGGESSTILPTIMADFAKNNVGQYVNTKVQAIEAGAVKAVKGEEEISIPCDTVVMAVGSRKNVLDLEGLSVPVYYAGDCSGERTAGIMEAVRGGYKAGNQV